ncbi:MAG: hypothetical protein ACREVE_10780 [Gammaproteobacteria bacterium]
MHFFIGTILWGVIFAPIDSSLPGSHWVRGVVAPLASHDATCQLA